MMKFHIFVLISVVIFMKLNINFAIYMYQICNIRVITIITKFSRTV